MDRDDIRAGVCEGCDKGVAGRNHQMTVEHLGRRGPDCLDDGRAERDVGNEVAIHHIKMDPIGAGRIHVADFRAKPGEVGREDRRGDDERPGHERNSEDLCLLPYTRRPP
jgi:hypothetical protein